MLLSFAFRQSEEAVYLHTISNDKLFSLLRLRAKIILRPVLIKEILFGDDVALTTHAEHNLQLLFSQFKYAFMNLELTNNQLH